MSGSSRPIRLLIVDDDNDLRQVLAARFERQGCQVLQAGTAEEALERTANARWHFPSFSGECNPCANSFPLAQRSVAPDRYSKRRPARHPRNGRLGRKNAKRVGNSARPFDSPARAGYGWCNKRFGGCPR